MIDFAPLLKIIPIFLIALAVPGPDFFMISSMALSRGRAAGFLASLGIACGNTIYATVSMLGLSIVFTHWHWLAIAIRVCGGAYLIYIGVQLWRSSFSHNAGDVKNDASAAKRKNPFLTGLLTNLTNPKAMAFFTSIFAVILPTQASTSTQYVIVFIIASMSVMWFSLVTLVLAAPAVRKVYMRWSHWIDRVAGAFFTLFGLKLIFSGRN